MISPQSPGLDLNDDASKRDRVGVTGITPVRLLPETLNDVRNDWFNDGRVPLNRLKSRFNEVNRSSALISEGIEPEKLLWDIERIINRCRERIDGGKAPEN
jgi:cobalamin biosynthesis protein CobT